MKRAWLVACIAAGRVAPGGRWGPSGSGPRARRRARLVLADAAARDRSERRHVRAPGSTGRSAWAEPSCTAPTAALTWAAQPTGSDADLWSVSFADAQHGWVGRRTAREPATPDPRHHQRRRRLDRRDAGRPDRLAHQRELRRRRTRLDRHQRRQGPQDQRRRRHLADAEASPPPTRATSRSTSSMPRTAGRAAPAAASGRRSTAARPGRPSRAALTARTCGRRPARFRRSPRRLGARPRHYGDSVVMTTNDGGRFWRPVPTGDRPRPASTPRARATSGSSARTGWTTTILRLRPSEALE